MKVTVLGYWGAYPEANEATAGYLLQHNGCNILLDCGSGVLAKLQNYIELQELHSVILSHYHADHIADIYSLQYAVMILKHMGKRNRPLNIYGIGDDPKFETLSYGPVCISHPIREGKHVVLEGLKISFMNTEHPVTCLAVRVEYEGRTLVYTADTSWKDSLVDFSKGADLLLCECNLYARQKGVVAGHMTSKECGELAKRCGARKLVLTHLPHEGDRNMLLQEASEIYKGEIVLAYSGFVLNI